ncbi:MAG: hypothetical protein KBD78_06030 [Oligoflexales bacterium]|nr:hypothetical protein [Oligoflexales bacterium]
MVRKINHNPSEDDPLKIRRFSASSNKNVMHRRSLDSGDTIATNESSSLRKKAFVFLDDLELSYDLSEAAEKHRITTYTYWSIESSMDTFWPEIDFIIISSPLWLKLQSPLFSKLKEKFLQNQIFILKEEGVFSNSKEQAFDANDRINIHHINFKSNDYISLFAQIHSELLD